MKKIAVIYWSGTGNTQIMAEKVAEGVQSAGGQATLLSPAEADADIIKDFDAIAFGCPSMGMEQLEETEFEPMFVNVKNSLAGRKIALFGSYGWGDGEWMRTWAADCEDAGCDLAGEPVIACGAPEGDAADACRALGRTLAG